jgi:hypothetical protein
MQIIWLSLLSPYKRSILSTFFRVLEVMKCLIPVLLYPLVEVPCSDRRPETTAFFHIIYNSIFSDRSIRRYVIKATDSVIQLFTGEQTNIWNVVPK